MKKIKKKDSAFNKEIIDFSKYPTLLKANDIISLSNRRYFRLNYIVKTSVIEGGKKHSEAISGHTSNISERGFFVRCTKYLPEKTKVNIIMRPHGRTPLFLEGEVAWTQDVLNKDDCGMGIIVISRDSIFDILNVNIAPERLKREYIRLYHRIKIQVKMDKKIIKGYTQNISYQGMFMNTTKYFPELSLVKIYLYPPEKPVIELLGGVVWIKRSEDKKNSGMGLYISLNFDEPVFDFNITKYKEMMKVYIEYINQVHKKGE